MRLLVTGGSGFVGRNLVEALRAKGAHEVLAPSHAELDLLDPAAVDSYLDASGLDAVVHSAVRGGDAVLEQTLRMQANLVRSLGGRYRRLLYFGSGAELAKHRDLVKIGEERFGEEIPRDPYGLAKFYCTEQARGRKEIVNLRLFGVFGPHEGHLYKFISNAIAKTLLGIDVVVRQDVRFDYLWIGDLAPIVERFLQGPLPHADFNVTPTESVTLSEIVRLVQSAAGTKTRVEFSVPGMNFEYTGSNVRLLSAMPGLAFTPMADAIGQLVEFYRARMQDLDKDALLKDDYARRVKTRA